MVKSLAVFVCALSAGTMLVPTAALADDPKDPAMRSSMERARDNALTRKLNKDQLAYVGERDARIMRNYRAAQNTNNRAYADAQAEYARNMTAWRQAVAACKAGRWDYCAR